MQRCQPATAYTLTQKGHFVNTTKSTGTEPDWSRLSLLDRPGFLIRRLNQVHGALFQAECGALDVTPILYSILTVLNQRGESEQSELALRIAKLTPRGRSLLNRLDACAKRRSRLSKSGRFR